MIEVNYGNTRTRSLFLGATSSEIEEHNLQWGDIYNQSLNGLLRTLRGMSYKVHYIKDSRGKSIIID